MTNDSPRQSMMASRSGAIASSQNIAFGVALLLAAIPLTTINFNADSRDQPFAVDSQTLLRLGLCAVCGVYGLWHVQRTLPLFHSFAGVWCILFGLWALVSVPFSDNPMYAAGAVFALWCAILFAPAVLVQLGGRRTIETLLAGTLLFIGVNWFLY